MKLKLLDYDKKPHEFEIGNLEDIASIDIDVITGDEIAIIEYKDGSSVTHDTANDRFMDYFDDSYTVYNEEEGINLLMDEKWINRKSSYIFLFDDD